MIQNSYNEKNKYLYSTIGLVDDVRIIFAEIKEVKKKELEEEMLMLNQCIFIGRISEITFYAKNQVIVKIKITNQTGMSDTFVSIDMSGLLVAKDQLKKINSSQ